MPRDRRQRLFVVLGGIAAGLLALGSGLLAAGFLPAANSRHTPSMAGADDSPPSRSVAATPAAPRWKPLPAAQGAFIPAQLVIEKLGVEAPIEVKGISAQNVMEAPDKPADAAWYRFTAKPGSGSNAVFSGHRDFAKVGPAIFWNLNLLVAGDTLDIVSAQQTELRYRVTQVWNYPLSSMPMQQILAGSPGDVITLITCAGEYTPSSGYDRRLVVRATRVPV